MDIYTYIQSDHRDVSDLMEQILFLRSAEKRHELFRQIKHALLLHTEAEEATFYAALKNKVSMKEIIHDAAEDHAEIKDYIGKLSLLPIESKQWLEQLNEFRHAVMHHVHIEEEAIFPKAKRVLSESEAIQLAKDMAALKLKKQEKVAYASV